MATQQSIMDHDMGDRLGLDRRDREDTLSNMTTHSTERAQPAHVQVTVPTALQAHHPDDAMRHSTPAIVSHRPLDLRFGLAVVLVVTAALLPVLTTLSNPSARDWSVLIDIILYTVSITYIAFQDYFLLWSRLFSNVVVFMLAVGFFAWGFRTTMSDSYAWIPMVLNIAMTINAQEFSWTLSRPFRRQDGVLPLPLYRADPYRYTGD